MPTTPQQAPERYQKQDTQPLYGLHNFYRWRSPKQRSLSPSDIDGWMHARKGDRHLFLEFKTVNEDLSKMGGQLEGLLDLSRRPGVQVAILFDPYWNDCTDERMDGNTELRLHLLRRGATITPKPTTIEKFADAVFQWNWNEGPLAQPIDYEQQLQALIDSGATAHDIAVYTGLAR